MSPIRSVVPALPPSMRKTAKGCDGCTSTGGKLTFVGGRWLCPPCKKERA